MGALCRHPGWSIELVAPAGNLVGQNISLTGRPQAIVVSADDTRLYAAEWTAGGGLRVVKTPTDGGFFELVGWSVLEGEPSDLALQP